MTALKSKDGVQTFRNPINPRPKWPDAMAQIDPSAEIQRVELDFELDPGQSIRVSVFDESNEWLTGGTLENFEMSPNVTIDRAPIDVTNSEPNGTRAIIVHHQQRGLGLVHRLVPANITEGTLRLTAQRCARISGRLVNDGEPLNSARWFCQKVESCQIIESSSELMVVTDSNVRFQLSGLGSERHVQLEAFGDGMAATRLSILTRQRPSDSTSGAIAVRTGLTRPPLSSSFEDTR